MRKLLKLTALLALPLAIQAQSFFIYGTVNNSMGPVAGVNVTITRVMPSPAAPVVKVTDAAGYYSHNFTGIPTPGANHSWEVKIIDACGTEHKQIVENMQGTRPEYFANFTICDSAILSINDKQLNKQISIFPNPVLNKLNIKNNGAENQSYHFKITTLNGAIVMEHKGIFELEPSSINVSNITPGMYMLYLQTTSGNYVTKFIKE